MENSKTNHPDINEVIIQGRIAYKYATEKATMLTINTGRATVVANYPQAVFFGDTKEIAALYNIGDYVKIVGNIQSSKRNPSIKNQNTLSIFGETVEKAETIFEEDFDVPGKYVAPINRYKLAGTITGVNIPNNKTVNLVVRTTKNGHVSYVKVIHFTKTPNDVIGKLLPGNHVMISGYVQTGKIAKNGEVKYLQSYIANEIL